MNIKNIIYILFVCNTANAHSFDPADCDNEVQQDDVYWCLMDKYQRSVLALKKEEDKAQKRLEKYDNDEGKTRGYTEEGTIDYEPYIHLARTTFPELHRSFILYREKQCGYSSLSDGARPGYRTPITLLYCKTKMNISQMKWLNDYI